MGDNMNNNVHPVILRIALSVILMCCALGVSVNQVNAASIIYVDMSATGANNGLSWTNAFTKLQDAITTAQDGDEIWVADGTYRPALPSSSRTNTFQLKNGVEIYGGFQGTEASRAQRQWETYHSILNGDLNYNDSGLANLDDNSYHVVTATGTNASAVLDGFFITGGNANGSDPSDRGGGITNVGGSPTLRNLVILGNHALHGAGMNNRENAAPMLSHITFKDNSAASFGGGMTNSYSLPVLINVDFIRNTAPGGGGLNNDASSHTLINVRFYGNSANYGGGMNNFNSNPNLTNVLFVGNVAAVGGGGFASENGCPVLVNSTFGWNSAPDGGGILQRPSCGPTITNSILWGNGSSQISGTSVAISYSLVEGGYPGDFIL